MLNETQRQKLKDAGYSDSKIAAYESAKKPSYGSRVKEAFVGGIARAGEGVKEAAPITGGGVKGLITGTGKQLGGIAAAISSPIAPLAEDTIGKGVDYLADKISESKGVQEFAQSKAGEATSQIAETVGDYSAGLGTVAGLGVRPKLSGLSKTKPATSITETVSRGTSAAKNLSADLIPTRGGIINELVSKSFDLSPGDLDKISRSTGNEVGRWVADNNLIRRSRAETEVAVSDFFKKNFREVRDEIAKVETLYAPEELPRFRDALTVIQSRVKGVPGLEQVTSEVSALLGKQQVRLSDLQRVKELMDEHFNLYKVTGDVGEGVMKEGLANIRNEIKTFLEAEVLKTTGADIAKLNNNVMTARAITEAIKTRQPRGILRSNIRFSDAAILFGFGGIGLPPVTGLAFLFLKKLAESPSIMLRVAKYLDGLEDAKKAQLRQQLESGIIPEEMAPFIKQKNLVGPQNTNSYGNQQASETEIPTQR